MRFTWIMLLPLCLAACAPLPRLAGAGRPAVAHRIRVRHPGVHADGPQSCTLYQLSDKRGFPTGYTMAVDSVICPDETCRISTVNMAWDALGHYQRLELPPGEFLEKGLPAGILRAAAPAAEWRGVAFTEADYRKLDEILKDAHSLLGQHKLAGAGGVHDKDLVDGITGATPAAIRDAVVEGASLTCYNLWHWANGPVAEIAKELTHRQCGEAMLLDFLSSDKPHYVLFALEHLKRHKLFSPPAVQAVNNALRGGDHERIDLGLAFLRAALPAPAAYFDNLGTLITTGNGEGRTYLLDRLAAEQALPAGLFDTLSAALPGWNNYYETHLFLRLAEKHGAASPFLITQTAKLLECPDFFIARRAHGFLSSQPALDEQTASRLQAFREKAKQEGRSL